MAKGGWRGWKAAERVVEGVEAPAFQPMVAPDGLRA